MPNEIEVFLGESEAAATARVLERLRRYVEVETPSRDVDRINALANLIAQDLEKAGGTIEKIPAPGYGTNIVATFEGAADGPHTVTLSHMDTVHPVGTIATQPFIIRDGRAEGPGTYDMKAGVAVAVESVLLLKRKGMRPAHPLRVIMTCDEEIGSHSSLPIIEQHARGAGAVLVTEPCIAGGLAKTARKGVLTYRMETTGRASHAGVSPQTGVSAIMELCRQIERMQRFARPELGTTINVGVIGGGTASNVVAAAAWAEIDVRVVEMTEGERINHVLTSLQPIMEGTAVKVERTEQRPPLERSPAVVALYERVRDIARSLGHEMGEGASGGGSDGSFTASWGIPTLDGLGCDGAGAHAADEHILIADLPYRLALFTSALATL